MTRHLTVIAMCFVAACGGSDDPPAVDGAPADAPVDAPIDARRIDAGPPDAPSALDCLGTAPPATAPDPMTVEGQVFAIVDYDVTPVDGATVELRRRVGGVLLATAATDAEGRFSTSVATGGDALDAWFTVTAAGRLPTHAYPGDPLSGGENAFLLVADAAEVAAWYADAAEPPYAAGQRTVIASIKDCENDSPGGVTVAVTPAPGGIIYYDDEARVWDPALPAATNGFALLADSAAAITVTPSIDGTALPARDVAPAADAVTLLLGTPRAAPSP